MKEWKVVFIGLLLVFFVFQITTLGAKEQDDLIKDSIKNLEEAQTALENGNQNHAFDLLNAAKTQIIEAMFPKMPEKSNEKELTEKFLIKPYENFVEFRESVIADSYSVSVNFVIENLTNNKQDVTWNFYFVDPSGVQRSGNTYGEFDVLGGASVIQSFSMSIKKSRFEFGRYTILLEPKGTNRRLKYQFNLTEANLN